MTQLSNEQYYVRWRGKVSGPFQRDVLLTQVRAGLLTRHHTLSQDQLSWIPAASLAWLFGPEAQNPGGGPESSGA